MHEVSAQNQNSFVEPQSSWGDGRASSLVSRVTGCCKRCLPAAGVGWVVENPSFLCYLIYRRSLMHFSWFQASTQNVGWLVTTRLPIGVLRNLWITPHESFKINFLVSIFHNFWWPHLHPPFTPEGMFVTLQDSCERKCSFSQAPRIPLLAPTLKNDHEL